MDGLFFLASKTVGMVTRVETWLVFFLLMGLVSLYRSKVIAARRWILSAFVIVAGLTLFPLGDLLLVPLESRHPVVAPPATVDGIIVLGGAEAIGQHLAWGGVQSNDAGERLVEAAILARQFPKARLIFSGGAARLGGVSDTTPPSTMARALWVGLGIEEDRIVIEDQSRNTHENAVMAKAVVAPKQGEQWLLVTSAFHMPRSVEVFERQGWQGIHPWPVDFRSGDLVDLGGRWRLDQNLAGMNLALKEYLGLFVYRVTGK